MDARFDGVVGLLNEHQRLLWIAGVLSYGVGDVVTTTIGLSTGRGTEAGPLAAGLVADHGLLGLFALKLVTLLAFYVVWRALSTPGRVAVPLALVVVGVTVTLWNLTVIL